MTAISIVSDLDDRFIRALFKQVQHEAVFAEASALRSAARKGRTQYVRRMSSKLGIPQKPIRSRSNFFGKKAKPNEASARAKVWVGGKRAITEKDTPKVLASPGLEGRPFTATMRNGKTGKFIRKREWKTGPKNSYRRLSRHYFERPDGQNTYLPIAYPKLLLTTDDSQRTLIDAARQSMENEYPTLLKKEIETRVRRLRRKQARRSKK